MLKTRNDVAVLVSRPYAAGTDLAGEAIVRSIGDSKTNLWTASQSLSRLRPKEGEDFSGIDRKLIIVDAKEVFSVKKALEMLNTNQKIDDAHDVYQREYALISEVGYKLNYRVAEMVESRAESKDSDFAREIEQENLNRQTEDSKHELQNLQAETDLSSTTLNEARARQREWMREKWSPEGKWFDRLKDTEKEFVLSTVFPERLAQMRKSDGPLYRALSPDQITQRMSKFFKAEDYPYFAPRAQEGGFRLADSATARGKGVPGAETGPVSVDTFTEKYPRLFELISKIPGAVERGYVANDGAAVRELQKIMYGDETRERPALNRILDQAGLPTLPSGPVIEEKAVDALKG
ncbi:MAG: hypothetical protein AAB356_08555, partial [Deltaproteobacteria bacterium]